VRRDSQGDAQLRQRAVTSGDAVGARRPSRARGPVDVLRRRGTAPGSGRGGDRATRRRRRALDRQPHPHPCGPLAELDDPAAVDREIDETQELIGDLSHPDRLFRPFGRGGIIDGRLLGAHALRRLEDGRFTCVLWNSVPRDWERPNGWVATCLDDVATRPWSVVVIHDLPTGAMDHLPALLDGLDAMAAKVVQEFPDECVPLRRGVRTSSFSLLKARTPR